MCKLVCKRVTSQKYEIMRLLDFKIINDQGLFDFNCF